MSGSVLGEILLRTRARVEERRLRCPLDRLLAAGPTPGPPRSFARALARPGGPRLIAEFKRRSPSRGVIREELAPSTVAQAYEAAGAAALSVLTEPEFFGGRLEDLSQARGATSLPTLRKDFVIDPYQVWEARSAGADAVLLIAAALSDSELLGLLGTATQADLDALVEVHDAAELDRALKAQARLVGVNNRDLKTLEVSLETALGLGPRIPDDVVAVAESGIQTGADLKRLHEAGFDAFLVGEHLMRAPDPGSALAALIRAGSAA
ncbi:MAG TPA: indole-3-glycerol phosphate synthase TrpC [Vicinamibacteria bacterium]|nr:indole-3-glycerol phosphate synthase TrpC [Vicinamibacteria bacterium]